MFNEALFDPKNMHVSFRHMQLMFTSSTGEVLEPDNFRVNARVGRASVDGEDGNIIGPGEKITYLYRYFPFLFRV